MKKMTVEHLVTISNLAEREARYASSVSERFQMLFDPIKCNNEGFQNLVSDRIMDTVFLSRRDVPRAADPNFASFLSLRTYVVQVKLMEVLYTQDVEVSERTKLKLNDKVKILFASIDASKNSKNLSFIAFDTTEDFNNSDSNVQCFIFNILKSIYQTNHVQNDPSLKQELAQHLKSIFIGMMANIRTDKKLNLEFLVRLAKEVSSILGDEWQQALITGTKKWYLSFSDYAKRQEAFDVLLKVWEEFKDKITQENIEWLVAYAAQPMQDKSSSFAMRAIKNMYWGFFPYGAMLSIATICGTYFLVKHYSAELDQLKLQIIDCQKFVDQIKEIHNTIDQRVKEGENRWLLSHVKYFPQLNTLANNIKKILNGMNMTEVQQKISDIVWKLDAIYKVWPLCKSIPLISAGYGLFNRSSEKRYLPFVLPVWAEQKARELNQEPLHVFPNP